MIYSITTTFKINIKIILKQKTIEKLKNQTQKQNNETKIKCRNTE